MPKRCDCGCHEIEEAQYEFSLDREWPRANEFNAADVLTLLSDFDEVAEFALRMADRINEPLKGDDWQIYHTLKDSIQDDSIQDGDYEYEEEEVELV